jgi:hypothetical protein
MTDVPNIVLDYPLIVMFAPGMETILFSKPGAEVFIDEHNIQWIKFIAKNGPQAGKEHMIRTKDLVLVRDDKINV